MVVNEHWYVQLFEGSREMTYKKGEIILRPDDEPQGVYCIKEGIVKLYSIEANGDERIHSDYIAGEIFPLAWAAYGVESKIYYQAQTNCVVLRLSRDEFIMRAKDDQGIAFLLFLCVVGQFVAYTDRVYNLGLKYASERLAQRLIFLGNRIGEEQRDGSIFINTMTQRDIAHSINLTPESLSREFEKFKRKGLVKKNAKTIILCDIKRLAQEI